MHFFPTHKKQYMTKRPIQFFFLELVNILAHYISNMDGRGVIVLVGLVCEATREKNIYDRLAFVLSNNFLCARGEPKLHTAQWMKTKDESNSLFHLGTP